tara:strand:+ start:221 stop:433 length:213 start_codon:yes stop_codon:yes gene_type:complete
MESFKDSLKLEKDLKDLYDTSFKEAFRVCEKIEYLDLPSKIIIQSALRQALQLSDYNFKIAKLINEKFNK